MQRKLKKKKNQHKLQKKKIVTQTPRRKKKDATQTSRIKCSENLKKQCKFSEKKAMQTSRKT